jgi:hypothetical protein
MTQMNKFEDLNGRLMSLWTEITHLNKFEDRQWTLLRDFSVRAFGTKDLILQRPCSLDGFWLADSD